MGKTAYPSVNHLVDLIGPTLVPPASVDWPAVQRAIGTVLPADYKALIDITGPIYVGTFICVFAPGCENSNINLLGQMGPCLGALQELKRDIGVRACPYPLWFEPGGLLPWAGTDNGNTIYWLTRGHPDHWPVVLGEARGPDFEEHRITACQFLAEFSKNTLSTKLIRMDGGSNETVTQVDGTRVPRRP